MAAIEPRNVGSEDYLIAGTQALELHHLYRAMAFLGQEPCSACARGRANERATLTRIVVWRLDRWGRSLLDLIGSLQELSTLGVGFVSLCEALDLTTPSGRALAGMLAVFAEFEREILRERVKAGIAQARKQEQVDFAGSARFRNLASLSLFTPGRWIVGSFIRSIPTQGLFLV